MLNPPGLCDLRQAGATSLNEAATGTQIHAKGEKRGVQRPRRAFQQSNQTPQRACQRGLPRMAGSRGLAQPRPRFARRWRGAPCCVGTATRKCLTRPFARRCLIARPATSICSRSSRSGPLDIRAKPPSLTCFGPPPPSGVFPDPIMGTLQADRHYAVLAPERLSSGPVNAQPAKA